MKSNVTDQRPRANDSQHATRAHIPGVRCSRCSASCSYNLKNLQPTLSKLTVRVCQDTQEIHPLCAFGSLRLCVQTGAMKTQSRKDARAQRRRPPDAWIATATA